MKTSGKSKKSNSSCGIIVDLSPEEKRALKSKARHYGISTTDFVRTVVNEYFALDVAKR